jgi:hypothetical protein
MTQEDGVDFEIHPHTIKQGVIHHLACNTCGKSVSSGFLPVRNEMGNVLVVRAFIQCPECIAKFAEKK